MDIRKDPFVLVVNEGSSDFAAMDLAAYARRIDFRKTAKTVIAGAKKEDKLRGNFQLNLMFSGGENQRRGVVEIADHYGCAMPGVNVDSESWIPLAVEMSHIARRVGIPWVVNPDNELKKRNKIFAEQLHEDNVFEGITIAILELFPNPGSVKEHVDSLNCSVYTHTLLFSQIVNLGGIIYRVLTLGYMRKSCFDSIIRRKACQEVADACSNYMLRASPCQIPGMTAKCYRPFYENIGSMGLGLMVEKTARTGGVKIQYAALLSQPHVNKPLSYVSPIATMICHIYTKNRAFGYTELLSMCLPVAHLCGFYSYLAVLDALSREDSICSDPELGVIERIMGDLVSLVGCYSGGGFRRHQVSYNCATANRNQLLSDMLVLRGMCLNSTEVPPRGQSYEQYCQQKYLKYLGTVKEKIKGAGELTGTHLICVLVLVGLLKPVGMIHCSQFATATSLFKEKEGGNVKNPCAQAYINNTSKSSKARTSADKNDRAQRLMESVLPHLRLKFPFMERSFIEQINCETYRKDIVYDFYGPGTTHLFVPPFRSLEAPGLYEMRPEMNLKTGRVTVVTSLKGEDTERVELPSIVRDKKSEKILLTSAESNSNKVQTPVRIPMEYIDSFPGLREALVSRFFVTVDARGERHIPSSASTTQWISSHPILRKLLRHFLSYPLPKSMELSSLRPGSFSTVKQRKGFKSPEQLLCDYTKVQVGGEEQKKDLKSRKLCKETTSQLISDTDASHTCSDSPSNKTDDNLKRSAPEAAGKLQTSTDTTSTTLNDIIACRTATVPLNHKRAKKNHSPYDAVLPVKTTSVDTPDVLVSENLFPFLEPSGQPMSIYDNIAFKSYKLHGTAGVDLVCKNSTRLPAFRRLHVKPSAVLPLGPLYAEVKHSVYHGMASGLMPSVFNKGCFLPVKCTEKTHVFQIDSGVDGKGTMYMSSLFGYELSRFYTVGACSLIDKLAIFTGAKSAPSRKYAGVVNWLFDTADASKKFFVQAIMITSGKPSYFRKLYYRMLRKIRGDISAGFEIRQVIMHLCLPGEEGTLFYAVLQPPHGNHGTNWCLVPAITAGSNASDVIYMDCWTWKSQIDLQTSLPSSTEALDQKDFEVFSI